ncbi:MAG: hypothetical protein R3E39_15475 [Anaerolineae bacterium]
MEKPKKLKPSDVLMDAIGFHKEDLTLNQLGKLSNHQKQAILRKRNIWLVVLAIWCPVFIIVLIASLRAGLPIGREIGPLILVVLLGLFCGSEVLVIHNDAKNGRAKRVKGPITLSINNNHFQMTIDKQEFIVKKHIFLAFKNGDPYRIYYNPRDNRILSAEWLRD